MKKATIILVGLVIILMGYQQKADAQTGVRVGLNYPDIEGVSSQAHTGFHAGMYAKINFLGIVALEPGLQYSQKGCKVDDAGTNATDRLHYIDVPLLIRLGVFPMVNIFAGPQASFLVARRYEGSTTFTETRGLKNYDMGGVVGLGVNLPLGFNVQGSYDFGLTSINYERMDTKNSVFKLSLGKNF